MSAINKSICSRWARLIASKSPKRIAAFFATHDWHAGSLTPDFELLDGSGAEGIARRKDHFATLRHVLDRKLADGGGFADAVDADDQQDKRLMGSDVDRGCIHVQKPPRFVFITPDCRRIFEL